jgi:hypothetical protein
MVRAVVNVVVEWRKGVVVKRWRQQWGVKRFYFGGGGLKGGESGERILGGGG